MRIKYTLASVPTLSRGYMVTTQSPYMESFAKLFRMSSTISKRKDARFLHPEFAP